MVNDALLTDKRSKISFGLNRPGKATFWDIRLKDNDIQADKFNRNLQLVYWLIY